MADFASTQNTGNLQKFIREIPSRGVPPKVNQGYLVGIGFKSNNDRTIPAVLKFIGVLEENGAPAKVYPQLRHKEQAPKVLGGLLKKAYSDLFDTYPDAPKKDVETLKNWFAARTKVGEASIRNIVQTFTALAALAVFDGVPDHVGDEIEEEESEDISKKSKKKQARIYTGFADAQICFNIQVQIPGEQTPDVYESIFKNLGKYVLGIQENE